jgi:hypothetical protein
LTKFDDLIILWLQFLLTPGAHAGLNDTLRPRAAFR